MEISDERLAQFKRIYKEQFGKELSNEEAYEKAIKLVRLLTIISKYMPKP